MSNDKLVEDA